MDISKFHRTIPLRPQDKPYMVVRDPDGKFWVEHCYAFGAASAIPKIEGRDICWLETVAIEILIYFLEAMGFKNIRLLIHSDNQGTIGAMNKSRSPNYWINMSIRRICATIGPLYIQPELEYIESAKNPANPISRGILGPQEDRLPLQFQLPDELNHVLFYYVE